MNAPITLHAAFVFPAARSATAFDSFAFRLVVMSGMFELLTRVSRSDVWAEAPLTVTVKGHELEFPNASLALQETDVIPIGKTEPEAGVQVVAMVPGQLSDAVELKVNTAPFGPVASIAVEPGQVMTGGVLSATVTVCVALMLLPLPSVAV